MKQVLIMGNIGNPAQMRITADGKQLVTFSIAVNNRDKSTTWFSIVGRASEQLLPYLSKGRQVFVMGDLEVKLYNGNIDLSVFADRIELCGNGKEETPNNNTPTPQTTPTNTPPQARHIPTNAEKAAGISDDELLPGNEESKSDVY